MRDIVDTLNDWISKDQPVAIATVVSTWGSSPRKQGSKMAILEDGTMIGSVSGGCVEGAVADVAMKILKGSPPQLLEFGVSDDNAWEVGLACGGSIEVFVQRLDEQLFTLAVDAIQADRSIGWITYIAGADKEIGKQALIDNEGSFLAGDDSILRHIPVETLEKAINHGQSNRIGITSPDKHSFFIDVISAASKLILIGGVHISIALAEIAKSLGFRTIVVDPRRLFASDERFPGVDQLIRSWPQDAFKDLVLDRETAIAVLTHDPKIDDPAIIAALEKPVFYIGVLGSRNTHKKRIKRLKEAGCSEAQLGRLHAPIGLNIGAQSPEEIALSIMAEITAARHGIGAST